MEQCGHIGLVLIADGQVCGHKGGSDGSRTIKQQVKLQRCNYDNNTEKAEGGLGGTAARTLGPTDRWGRKKRGRNLGRDSCFWLRQGID